MEEPGLKYQFSETLTTEGAPSVDYSCRKAASGQRLLLHEAGRLRLLHGMRLAGVEGDSRCDPEAEAGFNEQRPADDMNRGSGTAVWSGSRRFESGPYWVGIRSESGSFPVRSYELGARWVMRAAP
jgi:hypothetical protein